MAYDKKLRRILNFERNRNQRHRAPRKEERGRRLRGEGDQTMFIDLRFEIWQVARFRKERGSYRSSIKIS